MCCTTSYILDRQDSLEGLFQNYLNYIKTGKLGHYNTRDLEVQGINAIRSSTKKHSKPNVPKMCSSRCSKQLF